MDESSRCVRLRVEGDGVEEEEDASAWTKKEGKIWASLVAFEAYVRFVDDILLLQDGSVCLVSLESSNAYSDQAPCKRDAHT